MRVEEFVFPQKNVTMDMCFSCKNTVPVAYFEWVFCPLLSGNYCYQCAEFYNFDTSSFLIDSQGQRLVNL